MATEIDTPARRTRSDGERSRAAILAAAGKLATLDGLDGLTIGRLADHIGMSKSGLYAHFGSKEELQVATVAAAEEVFEDDVIMPAQKVPAGLPRLEAYCDGFLSHLERNVFPGGCFFTSVLGEFDTRPGRIRDRVAEYVMRWVGRHRDELVAAQQSGEIAADADIDQIGFEIESAMMMANAMWVLTEDPAVLDRARVAIADRISRSRGH
jgi:AcrR family transcriptional regulator